ncbi:hypothetical protein [Sessilibacter corallicola]|uniref:hypothetical protein n=1 Tax=Sessilibacter corallicola TaxID=2904075 RepID=UPI001E38AC98|nr:hypothetical protein [Sessilibacter corallicola]MCE2029517.1 hypothetical protein [Sessilibacter corallicola]
MLKNQYEEIQNLLITVDQTIEPREIARITNEESLSILKAMHELDSEDGYVNSAMKNAQALQEELNREINLNERIYRIRESDSQIAISHKHLEKAAALLAHKQTRGEISVEELNSFKLSLAWGKLMISVISYIAQGHQAINRGELLPAKAFYQKALSNLAHSSHPDPRKKSMLKQVKEIIETDRVALDEDLMVEVDLNPDRQQTEDTDKEASSA